VDSIIKKPITTWVYYNYRLSHYYYIQKKHMRE